LLLLRVDKRPTRFVASTSPAAVKTSHQPTSRGFGKRGVCSLPPPVDDGV
jgi:hypothetical protein